MSGKGLLLNQGSQLWRQFLDALYPRNCLSCFAPVGQKSALRYLCDDCFQQVEVFMPPQCHRCGLPFYGVVTTSRDCPHCKELVPVFGNGQTTFRLRSPMRSVIHALKYGRGYYALPDLVKVALKAQKTREFLEGSVLVPVPLHPWRKFKRTFNQSELIARALCKELNNTRVELLLKRTKWTQTQTLLTHQERQRNLRNVFALNNRTTIDTNQRYVIVDDVFTTGATLNSCCQTMLKGGATKLDIFALGHG